VSKRPDPALNVVPDVSTLNVNGTISGQDSSEPSTEPEGGNPQGEGVEGIEAIETPQPPVEVEHLVVVFKYLTFKT
jgi:hypothetical protein